MIYLFHFTLLNTSVTVVKKVIITLSLVSYAGLGKKLYVG